VHGLFHFVDGIRRIVAPHNSFSGNVCLYSKGPPVPDGH
jgi:hypothetical protein